MAKILAAVVSVSDSRTAADDASGDTLARLLGEVGAKVVQRLIVSDDLEKLRQTLYSLSERTDINLIITTGGTGLSPRDNTPEATRAVIDREVPGLAEAMRASTMQFTQMSMLSRGVCGTRNATMIINLPGSPDGVTECFAVIQPVLSHAVDLLQGKTGH